MGNIEKRDLFWNPVRFSLNLSLCLATGTERKPAGLRHSRKVGMTLKTSHATVSLQRDIFRKETLS
jgi:hypothetical protein